MLVASIHRFLALLALLPLWSSLAAANPTLVVDVETGAVVHADQAGVPWYPASLTKLMTAYITFEKLRDDESFTLNTELPVSNRASAQPASKMGMKTGSRVSVARALDALIIYSANDIAYVLAEGVSGSVEAFVDAMNRTARRLGMSATQFANPNGLPDNRQVTTARDMAVLARALIHDFPEHAAIFSDPVLEWGKRKLRARNSLLRTFEGADGMKTGFICAAGFNIVATATRGEKRLLVVVMGAASGNFRMDIAAHLLEQAFARNAAPAIDFGWLDDLPNTASRFVAPVDLRPQVCEKSGARPTIVKTDELYGWGARFGNFADRKTALTALGNTLANLRGVIDHGAASVVPGANGDDHVAILAGLSIDEVLDVCIHLGKAGAACNPLAPAEVSSPPAM